MIISFPVSFSVVGIDRILSSKSFLSFNDGEITAEIRNNKFYKLHGLQQRGNHLKTNRKETLTIVAKSS